MSSSTVKDLFKHAVHIGHRTQKWNPRVKRFLFGEKDGIHIINLEKTAEYFNAALDFIGKQTATGKTILFVSTKPQAYHLIKECANECGMPYVVSKWIPGLLTNFSTVKTRIKYLQTLKEEEVNGEFSKYSKKEISKLKKVIDKLQNSLGGVENMTSLPDAVFVVDVVRDKIVVTEARKQKIPVIGIIDSNADPAVVDYPIPGNDDALLSLQYLIGKITETIKSSKKSK